MDITLLVPEEKCKAGVDQTFELMENFYPFFKRSIRELKLGHLIKMPDNFLNNAPGCPNHSDINILSLSFRGGHSIKGVSPLLIN